jgi:hypothetical protein
MNATGGIVSEVFWGGLDKLFSKGENVNLASRTKQDKL